MPLPTVTLGDVTVSRLICGGNPFSGVSHKGRDLDQEMMDWYTTARMAETWAACEAEGINSFIGRVDAHIMRALREYWNAGGTIQWIAQTAPELRSTEQCIKRALDNGAKAVFIHGGQADAEISAGRLDTLAGWFDLIRAGGAPAGMAAHDPAFHLQAAQAIQPDFHMVCCFNCGSVHSGKGETFDLADVQPALDAAAAIEPPCIAYKVLGAGRYDPEEMLPRVYGAIKPIDMVLMGFWTKHHRTQVEDNAALVRRILAGATTAV